MKTLEVTIDVDDEGRLKLTADTDLAPGRHSAVLIVDEDPSPDTAANGERGPLPFIEGGEWPQSFSLRREDLYDDRGR